MKNLIFFLFLSSISFAQIIEGVVYDSKTNKPIQQAHVYITNIEQGTTTNFRGRYRLKLANTKAIDSVYVSHIGYKKSAFLYSKKKNNYIIYLKSNRNELNEVQLTNVKRQLNSRIRYNKLSSMKRGVHSFGTLLQDGKIYVVGGNSTYKADNQRRAINIVAMNPEATISDAVRALSGASNFTKEYYRGELLVYDLKLDLWETSDVKFRKRAHHNLHYNNNKLYVLGGKRLSVGRKYEYLDDKIEVFDNESNVIQIDDTNPHQAVDFASFTYDNKIIVMGGTIKKKKNGQKVYTDKVHLYDLKSGFWYDLPPMPSAKEANGVLIDNTIYLIGGANNELMSSIEAYDLVSGQWKKEGDLFQSFTKPAVTYNGDIVYVFEDEKLLTYNTKTKELNQYLIDLNLKASKLYYANNKLYVLGGFRKDSYSTRPSADLFSIDLNEFQTTKINKSKRL